MWAPCIKIILPGHNLYILNKDSQKEALISAGYHLCGFGTGAFKLLKMDDSCDNPEFEFKLSTHKDLIIFNGIVATVGKVVNDMRESKPNCEVCYHKIVVDPQNPKEFTLHGHP